MIQKKRKAYLEPRISRANQPDAETQAKRMEQSKARLEAVSPTNWTRDAYLVFLLLSMAREQRKSTKKQGGPYKVQNLLPILFIFLVSLASVNILPQ